MGTYQGLLSSTLTRETLTLESSKMIRNRGEGCTDGLILIFMRVSSRGVREMEEDCSGGETEVDTRDTLKMECNVGMVLFIERIIVWSMKGLGVTECLMVKEFKLSRMGRGTKVVSDKISSMVTEFSLKTILLFMVLGKIMSSMW